MNRAILVFAFAAFGLQSNAETPGQFAERFYRGYFRWQIRGVPTPAERNRISPFFSSEILRLYTAADLQRAEFERRFPFDPKHPELALKPPWCEGDPFQNHAEAISTFAIGRVTRIRGRIAVHAHLEFPGDGPNRGWTDILILDRDRDGWVIADIAFSRGSSLIAEMREGLASTERNMLQSPK